MPTNIEHLRYNLANAEKRGDIISIIYWQSRLEDALADLATENVTRLAVAAAQHAEGL